MTEGNVQKQLIDHIERASDRSVDPDTDLVEERVFDSMGFIELVLWVEERFGVTFEADELEVAFVSVAKIAASVVKKSAS
ncbi:MAG: acyl carrier protein [bacterium]|nr:acyl carrier protein [bacterium]